MTKWSGTYLTALIRAHGDVAKGSACETGVDTCAEGGIAFFAVETAAISDIEGEDDAVAFLEESDAAADFFDDTHILVACVPCGLVGYGGKKLWFGKVEVLAYRI